MKTATLSPDIERQLADREARHLRHQAMLEDHHELKHRRREDHHRGRHKLRFTAQTLP